MSSASRTTPAPIRCKLPRRRRSPSVGAALPTLVTILAPQETLIAAVSTATLIFLVGLGALGGWLGGASLIRPALRVGFWGAIAMAVTAGIGALVGKGV